MMPMKTHTILVVHMRPPQTHMLHSQASIHKPVNFRHHQVPCNTIHKMQARQHQQLPRTLPKTIRLLQLDRLQSLTILMHTLLVPIRMLHVVLKM